MLRILVLFGEPLDKGKFDHYFYNFHCPLVVNLPEVLAVRVNRVAAAIVGPSPFHLIVELEFSTEDAMQTALNSEPGQRMAADFSNFASGGVSVLLCSSDDSVPAS